MPSNLLLTKIIVPTRRSDVLRRPRLLDFLHEYIDRKLVLVSAAAGYGKTSLLLDFAADTELPVCWYTLDEADADPQVFIEYLVAAIQRQFPHFGGRTTALLRTLDPARNLDECLGALITDIHEEIENFFVLVLDDYHLVEQSAPVAHLLDRLLLYLPENAHLILASRVVPSQLTLTRLTARREVAGLGAPDLAFTSDEIRELVQRNYGIELSAPVAQELAAHSEGWIAGIVLTTPTLWRSFWQPSAQDAGPGSQLFEYLAGEVLAQQPPELVEFLLETSTLSPLNVADGNELIGRADAATLLALAEKRNLFVTRVQDLDYRYHPLFREFLQARLKQTRPAHFRELQRRAAAMYERHGNLDRAVEYWLAAEDWPSAARVLEVLAEEYYDLGRWTTLARWLGALPITALENKPALVLIRAVLTAERGDRAEAQVLFDTALSQFEQRQDREHMARTLLESARYVRDPAPMLERWQQALKRFPRHEFALHAQVYHAMGIVLAQHEDFAQALPVLERASELYELANAQQLQAEAETTLGNVYLVTGARARADAHFEKALKYWRRLGHAARIAQALNSIAVSRYQQGDLPGAAELAQEALSEARASGNLRIEAYVLATQGDVLRDRGAAADALAVYTRAAEIAEKIHEEYIITFARVASAEVWRAGGELPTAERVLQTALQAATAHHSAYEVALVQIALGALRIAQGEFDAATRNLEQALPLLERAQTRREVGRALWYLALAAFRQKRYAEANRRLRQVGTIGKELGEDQFLRTDAAQAPELIDFALRRRIAAAYFRRLSPQLTAASGVARGELALPGALPVTMLEESWPPLEIFTLGEGRVLRDGEMAVWPTATTKELFFFFATHPQRWRKEQLIARLWPEAAHSQANDLFHSSVYRIRRTLSAESLLFRDGVYQLNPEAVRWIDVVEFEQLVAEDANSDNPAPDRPVGAAAAPIERLERAIALYHGDYLSEFYGDWCAPRRERLRTLYHAALLRLAREWHAAGNAPRTVQLYQMLLESDPLHEEAYRELMRVYIARGQRSAARQTYALCVERLAADLGVEPMPETAELYRLVASD